LLHALSSSKRLLISRKKFFLSYRGWPQAFFAPTHFSISHILSLSFFRGEIARNLFAFSSFADIASKLFPLLPFVEATSFPTCLTLIEAAEYYFFLIE
jgi:hypothetical protein